MTLPLSLLLMSAVTGCGPTGPSSGAAPSGSVAANTPTDAKQATIPTTPPTTPLPAAAIGQPPWLGFELSPARDAVAVATPWAIELRDRELEAVQWRTDLDFTPHRLAFSRDGRRLAVVGGSRAPYNFVIIDAASGTVEVSRTLALPADRPSKTKAVPSATPTALMPGDGDEFWLRNGYGIYAIRLQLDAGFVALPDRKDVFVASQDGTTYYTRTATGLASADSTIDVGCRPAAAVVDLKLDRVLFRCRRGLSLRRLLLARASTGAVLREINLPEGYPGDVGLLDRDTALAFMVAPAKLGRWSSTGITWTYPGRVHGSVSLSPSGKTFASADHTGGFEVRSLPGGELRCNHAVGHAVGIGLNDDETAWLLTHDAPAGTARVDRLSLSDCTLTRGTNVSVRLDHSAFENTWSPAVAGFLTRGRINKRYGRFLVRHNGAATLVAEHPRRLAVNPTSNRVAMEDRGQFVEFSLEQVVAGDSPSPPLERQRHGPVHVRRIVHCGDAVYAYVWDQGWCSVDASGSTLPVPGLKGEPMPHFATCRNDTLVSQYDDKITVIRASTATVVARWTDPYGTTRRRTRIAIAPDEASLLIQGGTTGWRQVALPPPARP